MYSTYWDEYKVAKSHELIRRGSFGHLLYEAQREFFNFMQSKGVDEGMLYASRKSGKSFLLAVFAIWWALHKPNQIIRHIFPTLKTAKEAMSKIMSELVPALPADLQPRYKISEAKYVFPNGSEYCLGGADPGSVSGNRGPRMDLFLGDEICYWEGDIDNHLKSVFFPQMTQVKGAKTIYASTPPEDISHYSIKNIIPRLQAKNAFFKYTIYDSPLVDEEQVAKIIERCGGLESNAFRREYLCELVVDSTRRVVPEFDVTRHVVDKGPSGFNAFGAPSAYIGYQAMDVGVGERDFTACLSAIYDHNDGKVYIVAEEESYKPTIEEIARVWEDMQVTHLSNTTGVNGVVDAFEQLRYSLRNQYNLSFSNPKKGKVTDNVLFARQCFESDKVVVLNTCPKLIAQLKEGIWDVKGKEFSRDDEMGHLDFIAALVYLVRQVNWDHRPVAERVNIQLGRKTQPRSLDSVKERLRNLR